MPDPIKKKKLGREESIKWQKELIAYSKEHFNGDIKKTIEALKTGRGIKGSQEFREAAKVLSTDYNKKIDNNSTGAGAAFLDAVGQVSGATGGLSGEVVSYMKGNKFKADRALGMSPTERSKDVASELGVTNPVGAFLLNAGTDVSSYVGAGAIRNMVKGVGKKGLKKGVVKSGRDWGKWNEEIPKDKALMGEYKTIEKKAKADGTWMKDLDGNPSKLPNGKLATPEQWIQSQSKSWEKAYGSKGFSNVDESIRYQSYARFDPTMQPNKKLQDKSIFSDAKDTMGKYYNGQSYNKNDISKIHKSGKSEVEKGVYRTILPKTKTLNVDGKGNDWLNLDHTKDLKKLGVENKFIKDLKKDKGSFQFLPIDFSTNKVIPFAPKKNKITTNDLGRYLDSDKAEFNRIKINNVNDGAIGDVIINKQKPGNYHKSLYGNNGKFDMSDPNIYRGVDGNALTRPLTPFTKNEITKSTGKELGFRKIGNKKGLLDLIARKGAQAPSPMQMKSGMTVDTPFFGVGKKPSENYKGMFAVETNVQNGKYNWSNRVGGTDNYGIAPYDKKTGKLVKNIPLEDLNVYKKKWFSNNYKKLDNNNLEAGLKNANLQKNTEAAFKWGVRGGIADEVLNDGEYGKSIRSNIKDKLTNTTQSKNSSVLNNNNDMKKKYKRGGKLSNTTIVDMLKKKKLEGGGGLAALGLNAAIPGAGTALQIGTQLAGGVMSGIQELKARDTNLKKNTNPYGLMKDGGSLESQGMKNYVGPSHAKGGIPINPDGSIGPNGPEVEGGEKVFHFKHKNPGTSFVYPKNLQKAIERDTKKFKDNIPEDQASKELVMDEYRKMVEQKNANKAPKQELALGGNPGDPNGRYSIAPIATVPTIANGITPLEDTSIKAPQTKTSKTTPGNPGHPFKVVTNAVNNVYTADKNANQILGNLGANSGLGPTAGRSNFKSLTDNKNSNGVPNIQTRGTSSQPKGSTITTNPGSGGGAEAGNLDNLKKLANQRAAYQAITGLAANSRTNKRFNPNEAEIERLSDSTLRTTNETANKILGIGNASKKQIANTNRGTGMKNANLANITANTQKMLGDLGIKNDGIMAGRKSAAANVKNNLGVQRAAEQIRTDNIDDQNKAALINRGTQIFDDKIEVEKLINNANVSSTEFKANVKMLEARFPKSNIGELYETMRSGTPEEQKAAKLKIEFMIKNTK